MLNTDETSTLLQAQELFAFLPDSTRQEPPASSCKHHAPGPCSHLLPAPGTSNPSQQQEMQGSGCNTGGRTTLTHPTSFQHLIIAISLALLVTLVNKRW